MAKWMCTLSNLMILLFPSTQLVYSVCKLFELLCNRRALLIQIELHTHVQFKLVVTGARGFELGKLYSPCIGELNTKQRKTVEFYTTLLFSVIFMKTFLWLMSQIMCTHVINKKWTSTFRYILSMGSTLVMEKV